MFCFLTTILCSAAVMAISYPLIRRYELHNGAAEATAFYYGQIEEVDRDLASGTIAEPEAKTAKAEITRRLKAVAQDQTPAQPLSTGWRMITLVTSVGLVVTGATSLYIIMGSPRVPSAGSLASKTASQAIATSLQKQTDAMINSLRDRLKDQSDNAQGWQALSFVLFQTGKFSDAAEALAKASAIEPDNMEFKSAEAEALVMAAQGTVTPAARALIDIVLSKNPTDNRSRYYDALEHEQSGDQQGALDRWTSLLADAPADARWRSDVQTRIERLARALVKDVNPLLPPPPRNPEIRE